VKLGVMAMFTGRRLPVLLIWVEGARLVMFDQGEPIVENDGLNDGLKIHRPSSNTAMVARPGNSSPLS
jgi:hypothetical protein